jgi:hypothetical protein
MTIAPVDGDGGNSAGGNAAHSCRAWAVHVASEDADHLWVPEDNRRQIGYRLAALVGERVRSRRHVERRVV